MQGSLLLLLLGVAVVRAQQWTASTFYVNTDCTGEMIAMGAVPSATTCIPIACVKVTNGTGYAGAQSVAVTCFDSQPSAYPNGYAVQVQWDGNIKCSNTPTAVVYQALNQCILGRIVHCSESGQIVDLFANGDITCTGSSTPTINQLDTCVTRTDKPSGSLVASCPGFHAGAHQTVMNTTGALTIIALVFGLLGVAYLAYRRKAYNDVQFGAPLPNRFAIAMIVVRCFGVLFSVVSGVLAAQKQVFGSLTYQANPYVAIVNFATAVYIFIMMIVFAIPHFRSMPLYSFRAFLVTEAIFFILEIIAGIVMVTYVDGVIIAYNAATVMTFIAAVTLFITLIMQFLGYRSYSTLTKGGLSGGVVTPAADSDHPAPDLSATSGSAWSESKPAPNPFI